MQDTQHVTPCLHLQYRNPVVNRIEIKGGLHGGMYTPTHYEWVVYHSGAWEVVDSAGSRQSAVPRRPLGCLPPAAVPRRTPEQSMMRTGDLLFAVTLLGGCALFGLLLWWLARPGAQRLELLLTIAAAEGAQTAPPARLLDQGDWLVTHRLGLLRRLSLAWISMGVLGLIEGMTGAVAIRCVACSICRSCWGRAVWSVPWDWQQWHASPPGHCQSPSWPPLAVFAW